MFKKNQKISFQGYKAKKCPGQDRQQFPCNTHPCNMRWSKWGPCSVECDRGTQRAHTECQANDGDPWRNCSSIEDYKHLDFEWIRDCNSWDPKKCPRYVSIFGEGHYL